MVVQWAAGSLVPPGLSSDAVVASARHDVTSPADASEGAFCVDAASVDARERQRSSVFTLVNVWKMDSESETASAAQRGSGGATYRCSSWRSGPARSPRSSRRCNPRQRGCTGRSHSRAESHNPRWHSGWRASRSALEERLKVFTLRNLF